MDHEFTAKSLRHRGMSSGIVAAMMRELADMNACMEIPGAGVKDPFEFSRGGQQGGGGSMMLKGMRRFVAAVAVKSAMLSKKVDGFKREMSYLT